MTQSTPAIPVPFKLALRRARYQILPITTMLICSGLAGWLWVRHTHSATITGEASAVRVALEGKIEGILQELPQPVHVFDNIRKGQVVARLDVTIQQRQLERVRAEMDRMRATQPADPLLPEREAQVAELQAQLDASEIKSPIDGVVVELNRRPGEAARLTKPIMEIAGHHADFITGYVREDQLVSPTPGMKAIVHPHGGNTDRSFESYVASVAPQVEPIPARHLRSVAIPEWGLPVQIAIPPGVELVPGELLDITLQPAD